MYFDKKLEMVRIQLQSHYTRRKQKNPSYSIRSYARDLSIDASLLSKMLRGTHKVSVPMFDKIVNRLELSPEDLEPEIQRQGGATFHVLEADKFSLISDWYHYGLIELLRTKDFKNDPAWIASRLDISATEVSIALERLERLKLITISPDGVITDNAGNNSTGAPKNSSVAFRKLQRQLLEKAIDHLDRTPVEKRDNSSITVAINTKNFPKLITLINQFRKEFALLAENDPNADEVYNLSVSLSPCSKRS